MLTADQAPGAADFGASLRSFRLRAGLSQRRLADFSTLSVRAIRDLENGRVRTPRRHTVHLLAEALGLDRAERQRLEVFGTAPARVGPDPATVAGAEAGLPSADLGPLIGRDHELDALMNLFATEQRRLITITGIGGVGKTRLAMDFARALHRRQGTRVLWVPVDGRTGRAGEHLGGGPAAEVRSLLRAGGAAPERARALVGDQDTLVALDGLRVTDASLDLVTRVLAACPRARVLVTARGPAATAGAASLFPLAPLPIPEAGPAPDPAVVARVASVRMFLARMRQVRPGFRLNSRNVAAVVRVCRALDGLPAALEEGARWGLVYSPQQLAHHLASDPLRVAAPPEGREPGTTGPGESVRHALRGLSAGQRRLLTAMARHPGHWSVADAAAALGVEPARAADDIYALLVHGLLRRREAGDQTLFEALNLVRCLEHRDPGTPS